MRFVTIFAALTIFAVVLNLATSPQFTGSLMGFRALRKAT